MGSYAGVDREEVQTPRPMWVGKDWDLQQLRHTWAYAAVGREVYQKPCPIWAEQEVLISTSYIGTVPEGKGGGRGESGTPIWTGKERSSGKHAI